MRTLFILTICIIAALATQPKVYDLTSSKLDLFEEYIQDFGVVFGSENEKYEKFLVFSENVERIKLLNKKYPDAQFNLNKFALLSVKEFADQYLTPIDTTRPGYANVAPEYPTDVIGDLPESFDWRDNSKKVVTDVKDQGACGSCWAFSTTGNIEGQWALAGNDLTRLSEQNLVDCDHHCMQYHDQKACDAGCNGGLPPNAYSYVIENGGINTEEAYPYQGYDNTCRFKSDSIGAKVSNWTFVSQNEDQMAAYLVNNGPISVAVEADMWQFYFGGVFYLPCGTSLNHAVLVVGYGVETNIFMQTMPYWIVKNSWGSSWGKEGYIYVQRGNGRCGINLYASSAIVGSN